ncbi:MAG TPA: hypothetical protein VHT73_19140 [Thermodesulfobacteriota bacterium]|nr:hypothetical protein [Thermodesulfobacteriota bacterium]
MRNLTYITLSVLALVFVTKAAMAQDVIDVAPEQFKVLLENENVRVLEFKMKPGDKQEIHTHPATVHIELTPTKVKITTPDGKVMESGGKTRRSTLGWSGKAYRRERWRQRDSWLYC